MGRRLIAITLMLLLAPLPAFAQSDEPSRQEGEPLTLWNITKSVVFDPTTFAPAVVSFSTTRLDWNSSQVFFQNGFLEDNGRFTVSGRSQDRPISYGAGNRQILMDTLGILEMSALNNLTTNLVERVLIKKYPNHRKLLRTLSWIERSGVATYWSYRLSAQHVRAWQNNQRLARQFGYR